MQKDHCGPPLREPRGVSPDVVLQSREEAKQRLSHLRKLSSLEHSEVSGRTNPGLPRGAGLASSPSPATSKPGSSQSATTLDSPQLDSIRPSDNSSLLCQLLSE